MIPLTEPDPEPPDAARQAMAAIVRATLAVIAQPYENRETVALLVNRAVGDDLDDIQFADLVDILANVRNGNPHNTVAA